MYYGFTVPDVLQAVSTLPSVIFMKMPLNDNLQINNLIQVLFSVAITITSVINYLLYLSATGWTEVIRHYVIYSVYIYQYVILSLDK